MSGCSVGGLGELRPMRAGRYRKVRLKSQMRSGAGRHAFSVQNLKAGSAGPSLNLCLGDKH